MHHTESCSRTADSPSPTGLFPTLLLLSIGLCGWAAPAPGQSILNVERLQPRDVESWHWGVEGALSVSQGNSDYVDVLGGWVLGHRWSRDWIRLFTGLDYRTKDGDLVDSNRYLHLRYNRSLSERWQTFHFAQLQASHAVEARTWRMANLIVVTHPLTESVRLIGVAYPARSRGLRRFEDPGRRLPPDLSHRKRRPHRPERVAARQPSSRGRRGG